jgi:hypothetical protein
LARKLDDVSRTLKERLEEKAFHAYLDFQAVQGDITWARDSMRDALDTYIVSV